MCSSFGSSVKRPTQCQAASESCYEIIFLHECVVCTIFYRCGVRGYPKRTPLLCQPFNVGKRQTCPVRRTVLSKRPTGRRARRSN